MIRGQFTPIYTDYYLHLMQHSIRYAAGMDQMLKDTLAVLTLYLTARPWSETVAWTVNLRDPRVNLFVTGDSVNESVTGRIFTEDVREADKDLFYSQTTIQGSEPQISTMEISGHDPVSWISQFYEQSEQRPARAFRLDDETFVLITAQPDCDLEWLAQLNENSVSNISETEELHPLENRNFRFHCGCTLERILPILGSWRDRPDELFEGSEQIVLQCPRCAAKYIITRDMI